MMKLGKIIKDFWVPIAAMVSISVMWGSNVTRLNADELEINNIKSQISVIGDNLNSIRIDTAVIKQTVVDMDKQFK